MENYDVQSNDPVNNRYVATFHIPDEVLIDLQQNPNDVAIFMKPNVIDFTSFPCSNMIVEE
jgi:hypothetical protein